MGSYSSSAQAVEDNARTGGRPVRKLLGVCLERDMWFFSPAVTREKVNETQCFSPYKGTFVALKAPEEPSSHKPTACVNTHTHRYELEGKPSTTTVSNLAWVGLTYGQLKEGLKCFVIFSPFH